MAKLKPHRSVEQIAKKHNVDVSDIQKQLDIGEPIEHEHTKNHNLAMDIALQHLDEIPDYYTRLKKLESSAKKELKNSISKTSVEKKMKKVSEELSGIIDPKRHRSNTTQEKIRSLTKSTNSNEASVASSKLRPSAKVSLPSIKKIQKEEVKLVDKILAELSESEGLWANIQKRRKEGKPRRKPGEKGYPKTLDIGEDLEQARKNVGASKCWKNKKVGNPPTKMKGGEEVPNCVSKESTTIEDANGNSFLEIIDLIKPNPIKEAVRMKAQTGNLLMVTLNWRGKYYYVQMFFPQVKMPSRKDITFEIEKIYPGSKVVTYKTSEFEAGKPTIQVSNSPSKNYLLNNSTIGEEVEIEEAKKSEMPCNKPKAQSHGSGEQGKSHVVKACEGGKEKLIRFGQKGVKGSPKKKGESEEYANRRKRFQSRHAKNIAKGKMSAAYWANKVKW